MLEAEKGVLHFGGAVEGTGRWTQGNLEAQKGEKMDSPLRTSREN